MKIITHRGLDAENHHNYTESSREAFQFFLDAGFGLEFDVQVTKDGVPVISHDLSLGRLTDSELPLISTQFLDEFLNSTLPNGHTLTLEDLIAMMQEAKNKTTSIHALHLKTLNQSNEQLNILLPFLNQLTNLSMMVFDVRPEVAKRIKNDVPSLSVAASVAHPYDVERYNDAVGGTLISIEKMSEHTDVYDWGWLDEWDRTGKDGRKSLYNADTFSFLRNLGYKLALVSPELHATSPKLLGGESHQDAANSETLRKRWAELVMLKPDAVCTDYPFYLSSHG